MPDTRVEDETLGSALTGSEVFYMVQGGGPRKSTADMLAALAANPPTSDGRALGSNALQWSDAFFASGAVLNFGGGNYLVTHSAGLLTFNSGVLIQGTSSIVAGVPQFTFSNGASGGGNNNIQLKFHGSNAAADLWSIGTDIAAGSGSKDFHFFNLVNSVVSLTIGSAASNLGSVGIGYTTPASNTSTGALTSGGGLGVVGDGFFGATLNSTQYKPTAIITSAWQYDYVGLANISIANGGNAAINTGQGLIQIYNVGNGTSAIYHMGFGNGNMISERGSEFVACTTTPGAGKSSVQFNGSVYAIYNNVGSSQNYRVVGHRIATGA